MESKSFSDVSKIDFKPLSKSEEYNLSLNNYYESKDINSLFQFKGYNIKYESIRRTSIYKSLKE